MTSSGGGAPYLGWLNTRFVSGAPWPAMTLAQDLVIACAPQDILRKPPADLRGDSHRPRQLSGTGRLAHHRPGRGYSGHFRLDGGPVTSTSASQVC